MVSTLCWLPQAAGRPLLACFPRAPAMSEVPLAAAPPICHAGLLQARLPSSYAGAGICASVLER